MAVDDYIALLDDLDTQMLDDFHTYESDLLAAWETFEGNNGQMEIVKKHILPAVHSHIHNARGDWPYDATPDDYVNDMYALFDKEVMARAFSDTIDSTYSAMYEIWLDACDAEVEHDFEIDAHGGSTFGPHSTHAIWR